MRQRLPGALFAVVLLVGAAASVAADDPGWSINPPDFELSGSVTAEVIIGGAPLVDPDSRIAAFAGDEIRGVTAPIEVLDRSLYFLTLYANDGGEVLRFRLYAATHDTVVDLDESLVFEANAVVGAPDAPFALHGTLPPLTAVVGVDAQLPERATVGDAYPNPFNGGTAIDWRTPAPGPVSVVVHDLLGRPVRRLLDGWQSAGAGRVAWDGLDATGATVASGVYLLVVGLDGKRIVRRVALLR